jgi:hypothetical protein
VTCFTKKIDEFVTVLSQKRLEISLNNTEKNNHVVDLGQYTRRFEVWPGVFSFSHYSVINAEPQYATVLIYRAPNFNWHSDTLNNQGHEPCWKM